MVVADLRFWRLQALPGSESESEIRAIRRVGNSGMEWLGLHYRV
jgi:hypothetical protein